MGPTYPSDEITMQYIAWFHNYTAPSHPSLYFASHDPAGDIKYFEYYPLSGVQGSQVAIVVPIEGGGNPFGGHWKLPYSFVLEVFDGDWWDAAQIYRSDFGNPRLANSAKKFCRCECELDTCPNLKFLEYQLVPSIERNLDQHWLDAQRPVVQFVDGKSERRREESNFIEQTFHVSDLLALVHVGQLQFRFGLSAVLSCESWV
jgi:hypothetical protein